MESDKLYRVQKEDLPKVEKMLNQCFAHDPLYETLIPDPEVRKNLMPELFKCDMDEFYATCEIFADSADLNSVLVVSDEAEPYNVFQFYFTEAMAALQTDSYLIKEDPSLKTFRNFMKGEDYLNSTDGSTASESASAYHLSGGGSIHAASWDRGGTSGGSHWLCPEAQADDLLETHNPKNVEFYEKFGFKVYGVMEKNFPLKQYCLIREVQ